MQKAQIKTEIAAGVTTFFTMLYIVIVNPSVMSSPGVDLPFSGVMTATVTLTCLMTLMMGLYAKLPFAVAPGMGLNAFFAYTIIVRNKIPWQIALGIVFWAGVIFLICSLTPIRKKIAEAIPQNLRMGAAVGIGIFLTFLGLKNCGLIISDPATLVRLGPLDKRALFAMIGFIVMVMLSRKKSPFAFLAGIGLVTFLGFLDGRVTLPEQLFSAPDFHSLFFKLDFVNSLQLAYVPAMVTIFFTDLFDSISAFMGCSQALGLKDENGEPKNLREGLIVDSWATLSAGLFGTSAGTTFIESAAGIEVGGRTGLTAVVTALCFVPCLFIGPIASIVPPYATAPVLIFVGALMFRTIKDIKVDHFEELVPAFLAAVMIPLTFSITQGILWGVISHVVLHVAVGRRKEISPVLYTLSAVCMMILMAENFSKHG